MMVVINKQLLRELRQTPLRPRMRKNFSLSKSFLYSFQMAAANSVKKPTV